MGSVRHGKGGDAKTWIPSSRLDPREWQNQASPRVLVPFSKGFAFSVLPEDKATGDMDTQWAANIATQDSRDKLTVSKRMVEKGLAKANVLPIILALKDNPSRNDAAPNEISISPTIHQKKSLQ